MRTLNLENPVFKIPRKPPQMDPALYMVIKHYYDKTTAWRKLILMIGGFPENLRTLKEVLQSIYKEDSIVFDYRSKAQKIYLRSTTLVKRSEKESKSSFLLFCAVLRSSKNQDGTMKAKHFSKMSINTWKKTTEFTVMILSLTSRSTKK